MTECMPRVISQINIHILKASLSFGDRLNCCEGTLFLTDRVGPGRFIICDQSSMAMILSSCSTVDQRQ